MILDVTGPCLIIRMRNAPKGVWKPSYRMGNCRIIHDGFAIADCDLKSDFAARFDSFRKLAIMIYLKNTPSFGIPDSNVFVKIAAAKNPPSVR